jgi:hypothetical protein
MAFPLKEWKVGKDQYNLSGITSIEGNNKNIKYKTYTMNEGKDD